MKPRASVFSAPGAAVGSAGHGSGARQGGSRSCHPRGDDDYRTNARVCGSPKSLKGCPNVYINETVVARFMLNEAGPGAARGALLCGLKTRLRSLLAPGKAPVKCIGNGRATVLRFAREGARIRMRAIRSRRDARGDACRGDGRGNAALGHYTAIAPTSLLVAGDQVYS
jgi:hypothetical protein